LTARGVDEDVSVRGRSLGVAVAAVPARGRRQDGNDRPAQLAPPMHCLHLLPVRTLPCGARDGRPHGAEHRCPPASTGTLAWKALAGKGRVPQIGTLPWTCPGLSRMLVCQEAA